MITGLLALLLVTADSAYRRPASVATPTADSVRADTLLSRHPLADSLAADSIVRTRAAASAGDSAAVPVPFMQRTDATVLPRLAFTAPDTLIRKKRKLVEYSEWYGRRLAVHRALSWAMLPLFAVSYYTGDRLINEGRLGVPAWVRVAHPWVATADVAVFGVNTVTGVWNLWDARHDPEGRTRRIIHSVLFIAADAGFAYAGSIGKQARDNGEIRDRHKAIALSSMGVSTLGWVIMLFR